MPVRRIIPCLDVRDGSVVKGQSFVNLKTAGDPVELARRYSDQRADELALLDISATLEGRPTLLDVVQRVSDQITMPLSVGGGVKTCADFLALCRAGADKVVLNTQAVLKPELITDAATKVGSQCVVVAIDTVKTRDGFRVCTHAGSQVTQWEPGVWAAEVCRRGAGELLVTSIDTDGQRHGYDVELLLTIREVVDVPIIASGGAGKFEHFLDVFKQADVDAALAASVFHYGTMTIGSVKRYLAGCGIDVRT